MIVLKEKIVNRLIDWNLVYILQKFVKCLCIVAFHQRSIANIQNFSKITCNTDNMNNRMLLSLFSTSEITEFYKKFGILSFLKKKKKKKKRSL